MKRLKVRVLYEYGVNMRPHASASLRLIRPLSYPRIREQVDVSFGYDLGDASGADLVLVDRFWKPDITPTAVCQLAEKVHRQGARLVYWFDDNFLLLEEKKTVPASFIESFKSFLEVSDGFVISTPELKALVAGKPRVVLLPSALDERIIVQKRAPRSDLHTVTIGYMGSATHDGDLGLVLPALEAVHARYPGRLRLQIVGAVGKEKLEGWKGWRNLPVDILQPLPQESEYQLFMLWFSSAVRWDFAIAPLVDDRFNRYKSDIKFLDYTAASAPGIFSRVSPYVSTIEHGKTGLVIENTLENWVSSLEEMVENPALRLDLLKNATGYLYQHRVLAQCWDQWLTTLQAMMA